MEVDIMFYYYVKLTKWNLESTPKRVSESKVSEEFPSGRTLSEDLDAANRATQVLSDKIYHDVGENGYYCLHKDDRFAFLYSAEEHMIKHYEVTWGHKFSDEKEL